MKLRTVIASLAIIILAIGFGLVVDQFNGWLLPRWQINAFFAVMLIAYLVFVMVLIDKLSNPRR